MNGPRRNQRVNFLHQTASLRQRYDHALPMLKIVMAQLAPLAKAIIDRLWMQFFVPLQHLNKLLYPPNAGFSFFSGLDSEKYGVPILVVQCFEKGLRAMIFIECRLQICGDGSHAG